MTPEELANGVLEQLDRFFVCQRPDYVSNEWRPIIATAIHEALLAETEACALHLERSALRFPDDPRIQAVLRGEAESIRARKES